MIIKFYKSDKQGVRRYLLSIIFYQLVEGFIFTQEFIQLKNIEHVVYSGAKRLRLCKKFIIRNIFISPYDNRKCEIVVSGSSFEMNNLLFKPFIVYR